MSDYNDGTGRWHSAYMASTKSMDNDSLRYVIEDCRAAMAAMPDNPKCGQYADEVHYCTMELHRRAKKVRDRQLREVMRGVGFQAFHGETNA